MLLKNNCFCRVIMIALCCLFASGCMLNNQIKKGEDKPLDNKEVTLQDLAYNRTKNSSYRIGIEEDGKLVPYLVLTDDYNGDCLLLREYLLDEPRKYNIAKKFSGYYEDSEIDKYLNEEFINRFTSEFRNSIINSIIVITDINSLGGQGKNTISINRKVFLPSFTEMNINMGSRTNLKEGEPLEYFAKESNRIAYYENGQAGSWWLRTASSGYRDVVCGVSVEGALGIGGINGTEGEYLNGIRPAFCLKRETKIIKENGELYVLVQG
jgi:hypothetical protein